MTNRTSQANTEVVGKIAGIHGEVRVIQHDGVIAVARSGADLHMGAQVQTFGSSIVVVKIDGFKPISLGHDANITIDQALLDSMKDEEEGSLEDQINFDALAQAIESGGNLEEILPATAAGGEGGSASGGASTGSTRLEFTNNQVSPESGFNTSATQNSQSESFIDNFDYFNNPPIALGMPGVAVDQDANVVLDVSLGFQESDEGQSLSFTVSDLPDGLSFDPETNLISGAATNDAVFAQDGEYIISITAQDDSGAPNDTATTEFILNVNNVNDGPLAGAPFDLGQIAEDGSVTFNADLLLEGASDIDMLDVLSVADLAVDTGNGSLQDNGDGTFTFTPEANWFGDVEFAYQVSDGQGGEAPNSGVLHVASVNDLPVVNPDFPLNITPETTVNVDVLANDVDVDRDVLSVENASADNGSVVIEADGSISYTPNDDFVGNDTIHYTVSDGNGGDVDTTLDVAVVYNPGRISIDPISEQETALPTFSGSSANLVGNIVLNIDGNDYEVLPVKDGNWSFALPAGAELNDGEYTILASGWDALGNPAQASESVVIDVEMPNVTIDAQALVTDSAPTFTGSSEHTDGNLTLELNGNTYQVPVDENGDWSFTSPVPVEDGEYNVVVSGGDAQGNSTSASSAGLVDAQLPVITIDDQDQVSATPSFSGSAEHTDGELELVLNGESYSVSVDENGQWQFAVPNDVVLADGDYDVVVSGADPQGNTSSAQDIVTVDELAPSITIDPITSSPEESVDTDLPVITGGSDNIEGDLTVTIGDDEYTVTPDEDGNWSIEIPEGGSLPDGEHTVIVEGNDGQGNDVSEEESFVVDAVDDIPTITGDFAAELAEDSASILIATGDINAEGGDPGETLFIAETVNGTYGEFSINEEGNWEYQADNSQAEIQSLSVGDNLQESFAVTNIDGVTSETVTITITGTNDLPVVSSEISSTASEDDAAYSIDLLAGAGDVDANDVLNVTEFSIESGDASAVSLTDNTLSIDPSVFNHLAQGESETITFSYFVEDNQGGRVAQTGSVTVNGQNDVPTIQQGVDLGAVSEDGTIEITQAQLLEGANDVDGDILSISDLELTEGQGTLLNNNDGTWTFSPATDWNGSVAFSFDITDGVASISNTALLSVTPENDAPEVTAINLGSIQEDGNLDITEAELLAGAADIDGDTLSIENLLLTSGEGELVDNNNGTWTFTPSDNWNGDVAFSFDVNDGTVSVPNTASLAVAAENDAPEVVAIDLGSIQEDGSLDITASELLAGATDVDGDSLSIENLLLATGDGELVDNNNGTWTFTPSENWNGDVAFSFDVNDGTVSIPNTASLAVTAENDAPEVAAINLGSIQEDGNLDITEAELLAGATDIDGDSLSIENLLLTSGDGDLVDNNNGTWTFTPSENWNGDVAFSFDINDGTTSVPNTASLAVNPENDAPEVAAINLGSIQEDGNIDISEADLLAGATDIDGDSLSIENLILTSGNGELVNNNNGTWTFTPSENWNGDVAFSFDVNDGTTSVTNTASLSVTAENDAPTVSAAIATSATEDDASFTLDLLSNASDIDGDTLSITNLVLVSGDDTGVTLGENSLSVNPNAYNSMSVGDAAVVIEYSYDIVDGEGASVSQTATITVTAENDQPSVSGVIAEAVTEDDAAFTLNLLEGASDPDANDILAVDNVVITGDFEGAITLNGNELNIDPSVYNALRESDTPINIAVSYNIVDSYGGLVSQSATVSITGENDIPTITGDFSGEVIEDSADILSVSGDVDASGGDTGEDGFIAETLSGTYGDLSINDQGSWTYSADNNQVDIQSLIGNDDTLTENFVITNADGETTQNIGITIRGSGNGVPEIFVEDGAINSTIGSIDKEFIGDDYVFASQDEASDANGLAIQNMLVEFASDITVTFLSETAGFANTLGWYSVGADGSINDVNLLWGNANDLTAGDSITLNDVPEGEIGFFIIQDGYSTDEFQDAIDAALAGDGVLRFETSSGEHADVNDSEVSLRYYSEGDAQSPSGDSVNFPYLLHATHGNLNYDALAHSHSGILDGDVNTLVVGFEDLIDWVPGISDWDLQDLVFSVQMRSADNFISDIAPSLQITDDGSDLSAASISLSLARSGDFLILSDDTELLADAYGIAATYDSATRTMQLSGDASIAEYEEILSSVQLMNDEVFGSDPRQVNFSVTDSEGLTSEIATVNLNANGSYDFAADDFIAGDDEANSLSGLLGDDVIFGAGGDDQLSGGAGSDTFIWQAGDEANTAQDRISDFEMGLGGDVLNFSDLLQDESQDAVSLDAYFDFASDGTDTTINIDVAGDGSGADMSVVLEGVDLSVLGGDQMILQSLLDNGNVLTD